MELLQQRAQLAAGLEALPPHQREAQRAHFQEREWQLLGPHGQSLLDSLLAQQQQQQQRQAQAQAQQQALLMAQQQAGALWPPR